MTDSVQTADILTDDRVRADAGDIDSLTNSIKDFGLIQPIVLVRDLSGGNGVRPKLVAGGRRLTALRRLGVQTLRHGRDFIWRDEVATGDVAVATRLRAIELEENLRRKDLTWQEVVTGKKRLLEIMQQIHGVASVGGRTRAELRSGESSGFSIRKLAAMLGETPANTAKDIQVAGMLERIPALAQSETKEGVIRKLNILTAVASMTLAAKNVKEVDGRAVVEERWKLYEGDFVDFSSKIPDGTADLIYTDLPFGVDLHAMSKHNRGVVGYTDSRNGVVSNLVALAREAYRLLRMDRFAVFFFGFNYYSDLADALRNAKFEVSPVPVIWYKHTRSAENPNTRYANAYDAALIAMKGSPVFIRPGQTNVVDIPAITPSERFQIAQQPVELVERFLLDMTSENALVVDFMAGSGTTGVAALKNKRRVIMFEQEPAACAVIKARMSSF